MGQVQRYFEDHFEVDGATLKIKSGALSTSGVVVDTRAILTTSPGLTGGGDLSADRTIALAWSSAAPAALGVAASGSSGYPARSDHVHALPSLGTLGAASDSLVVHLAGTETVTGDKTFAGTVRASKIGVGMDPSALPGDAVACANASYGVVFRNVANSAFLRAVGWSSDTVVLGDNSASGVQVRVGSGSEISLVVNSVTYAYLASSGLVLKNNFALRGLNTSDEEKNLAVVDADDFAVLGSDTLDLRLQAASQIALGVDGSSAYTPPIRGALGSGTDLGGTDLEISPGLGTGSGNAGRIKLHCAVVGTTGTTQHTLEQGLRVEDPGNDEVAILVRLKRGSTPAFERVKVGAADSAGTGFRALCVPN